MEFLLRSRLFSDTSNYKNINKPQYDNGLGVFLGVQYFLSPHFSISTEPMLYYKYIYVVDRSSFQKDNKTSWSETGFGRIGFVELNFHLNNTALQTKSFFDTTKQKYYVKK
jgi:hypothetical protein